MPRHPRCRRSSASNFALRLPLSKPRGIHGASRRLSQDIKLPLHYAATKGAQLEVMELLLGANAEAVTAADKVRRRVHRHRRPRS